MFVMKKEEKLETDVDDKLQSTIGKSGLSD